MPLLRLGSRGPDVAELQTLLTAAFGVYDGDFIASLNLPARFAKLVFWNSAYGPKAHRVKPFGPPVMWQYAGNVEVAGSTVATVAVDYNRAFGGVAALRRALGTG